jgi:hypothetical protein
VQVAAPGKDHEHIAQDQQAYRPQPHRQELQPVHGHFSSWMAAPFMAGGNPDTCAIFFYIFLFVIYKFKSSSIWNTKEKIRIHDNKPDVSRNRHFFDTPGIFRGIFFVPRPGHSPR